MESELFFVICTIFLLLIMSAFFSGSETCLTAASRHRMHNLEQSGVRRAHVVNQLLDSKERLIGGILLGNNLVNILASALATSVLIRFFGETGVVYATFGMTLLVLIFAEVLPKTYAIHNADSLALKVAPVIRPIVIVLAPITGAVRLVVAATLRLVGVQNSAGLTSEEMEEELRGAIDLHKGEEENHEREMLRSILDLADVEVEAIMSHRQNVFAVNVDMPLAELVDTVLSSPYTRLPMWKDDPDNIVGVVHAKALLRQVLSSPEGLEDLDLMEIANDPWFIPENTDLLSQLQAFRNRKEHFAIVVDEYGVFLGIVTLEDILEEIVGEIEDEHDEEIEGVQVQGDGSIIVDGTVTIRDLNRRFEWRLPDEEAATIAGLVLHEARRIPDLGQVFVFHNFSFEILSRKRNQITSMKIRALHSSA